MPAAKSKEIRKKLLCPQNIVRRRNKIPHNTLTTYGDQLLIDADTTRAATARLVANWLRNEITLVPFRRMTSGAKI